ncbi:MAG: hypothetical protein JRH07_07885 [Deltaproteobacteria bacterium]|nr:hypothetical protein [Deltaproteobacteria bacterium]MBW2121749.1 hypothetical protein [Deltaproteobacteria bacterium]
MKRVLLVLCVLAFVAAGFASGEDLIPPERLEPVGIEIDLDDAPLGSYFLGSGPGFSGVSECPLPPGEGEFSEGDYFEGSLGLTPVSGVNPAGKPSTDTDGDGLTDSFEEGLNDSLGFIYFDPEVWDTDGDGTPDGREICLFYEIIHHKRAFFRVIFGENQDCEGGTSPL